MHATETLGNENTSTSTLLRASLYHTKELILGDPAEVRKFTSVLPCEAQKQLLTRLSFSSEPRAPQSLVPVS
jgi:hypothetical protein